MKNLVTICSLSILIVCCKPTNQSFAKTQSTALNDTVRIVNDSLEYEVTIIDPGFNSWLVSSAQPRQFYTQNYMEVRNRFWYSNGTIVFYRQRSITHNYMKWRSIFNQTSIMVMRWIICCSITWLIFKLEIDSNWGVLLQDFKIA